MTINDKSTEIQKIDFFTHVDRGGMHIYGAHSILSNARVIVELRLALFHRVASPNGAVTRTRK